MNPIRALSVLRPPLVFAGITVALALALVGAAALVNWRVDPYGLFGVNRSHLYFSTERLTKQGMVEAAPGDGIVLGASTATEIDPDLVTSTKLLNLAWSAGIPEEFFYFLRDRRPQRGYVVIGLDFFMFDEAQRAFVEESEFRSWDPRRSAMNLASIVALRHSVRALIWRRNGAQPFLTPRGARFNRPQEAEDRRQPKQLAEHAAAYVPSFRGYRFSERRIEALRAIRQWSEAHCVPLVVYLSPVSIPLLAHFEAEPLATEFRRFVGSARAVFPDLVDLAHGPYSDPANYWARDSVHLYPSVASRMFEAELWPRIRQRQRGTAASCAVRRS